MFKLIRPIRFLALLLLSCSVASGQTAVNSGLVRGVVADGSGAVIPNATIALFSGATGTTLTRTSNSAGMFVFAAQPVGSYSIEVKAAGFRAQVVDEVEVQVGQATSMDPRGQPA